MTSNKPQRAVDWEAVWKSLNWDDESRQQSADQERLRQRARHYAEPIKEADVIPENARTVLTFDLGSERYGVDVMVVRGIRPLGKVARVPGVPPFYRGVVNVRGQIRSVLDLRAFFQIPYEEEMIVPDEVVICYSGHLELALLAHQVIGVETVPPAAIKAIEHMPYTWGITKERIILLDIPGLFTDERLIIGGVRE
jgi:purine-binding chemotaxis protein CheW